MVSGNARGQFGGVITTRPVMFRDGSNPPGEWTPHPGVPEVFGTLGLTDIEGHEGLSLLMLWNALFHPNYSWDPDGELPLGFLAGDPIIPPYFGGPGDAPGDGEKTGGLVEQKRHGSMTQLHEAAKEGDVAAVERLLDERADLTRTLLPRTLAERLQEPSPARCGLFAQGDTRRGRFSPWHAPCSPATTGGRPIFPWHRMSTVTR